MKTFPALASCLFACSLLAINGCAKEPAPVLAQVNDPVLPATPTPPAVVPGPSITTAAVSRADPFAEMSEKIEQSTFAKHDGLSEAGARMDRGIEDQVAMWKTAGHNVTLATDEKLHSATDDFTEKLRMMSLATPESWDTAKHNARMALETLRSAYTESTTVPAQK